MMMNIIKKAIALPSRFSNYLYDKSDASEHPEKYRIRFTGYYPEPQEYFENYYFSHFFNLTNPVKISSYKPDIEFFSVWDSPSKALKSKAKCKIFYTGECVHSDVYPEFRVFENHLLDSVDLSMGFDYLNKPNYIRYPLWILYYFNKKPVFSKDEIKSFIDSINSTHFTKSRDIAMIVRHDRHGSREKLLNALPESVSVCSAGGWRHNDDSLWNEFKNDKKAYLDQFKFNICTENFDYPGYVTEKLFQAFYSDCIPVYWGSGNKPEPEVINYDAVIFYDPENPGETAEKITTLLNNQHLYEEFRKQPKLLDSSVDYIYDLNVQTHELFENLAEKKGLYK
ncbi:MAG: hypothetical protein J6Y75_03575 [Spirochaetaceae bacterium]|nr:hypothetical protein [Spirochaetaceae bacterium]